MTVTELLKRRLAEAKTNRRAVADIAYALRAIRESDLAAQGRIETIQELQQKADEAVETHDPEALAKLTDALNAFLNEELNEVLDEKLRADKEREEEERMANGTDEGRDERSTAAEADDFMKYDMAETDEDADARRTAAEADDFMKYGAEPAEEADGDGDKPTGDGISEADDEEEQEEAEDDPVEEQTEGNMAADRTMTCEACGHEQEMPVEEVPPQFAESKRKQKQLESKVGDLQGKLTTARKQIEALKAARGKKAIVESERAELVQLRAYKRENELKRRARAAIREAKAVGLVKPDELVTFKESQWPILMRNWMAPDRSYGTGQRDMPSPGRARRGGSSSQSAADVFEESFSR